MASDGRWCSSGEASPAELEMDPGCDPADAARDRLADGDPDPDPGVVA